jgi:myo-inositol-1(or 4)-monophosphatase
MNEVTDLLALTKRVAINAGRLIMSDLDGKRDYEFSRHIRREIKAHADGFLNKEILDQLRPAGLSILSEESGMLPGDPDSALRFIVDPLDGTVNFVRDLGSSAISIALWRNQTPVFGVLCRLPDLALTWGGAGLGAFLDDKPITVSDISSKEHSVLCTGVPSRLDLGSPSASQRMVEMMQPYGKVRMFGAASLSLLHVAKGAADAYMEQEIMLWDVAAGLALVEGAGGKVNVMPGRHKYAVDVFASNSRLSALKVV